MDYGHDLLFGSFLTPSADRPGEVVRLAQVSEEVGLDLVTIQDHPYQPAFLDTWTLLSYLGAVTRRVHLTTNVANLPLRNPAVLGRSAASLDRLTGGRVALGLGAGAFWDAVVAMGGRRLEPAEAVRSLEEATEIIRGVWDTQARGGVRVDGEVYRVEGAKRGPAPAHDVPIWFGVYGPRMQRLTARVADGWLPSLGYTTLEKLAEGNARIDDAAAAVGRDPRAVRRLLNVSGRFGPSTGMLQGPPDQWVEELAHLALELGTSTFILGGDDERALRTFGEEVAPAVRELVAQERAGRTGGAEPGPGAPSSSDLASPSASTSRPAASREAVPGVSSDLGVAVTPAPETRLLDRDLLGEEDRPRRRPDPAATYTDVGREVGKHLVDVHDMLRGELTKIRDLVAQVRTGVLDAGEARSEINRMTMRQNAWTVGAYCEQYCRVVTGHHTLEDDQIFGHLRRQDPELEPVVDRLVAEHRVIHDVLEGVDRALVDVVRTGGADPARYDALQEAVDALTDTLLSHFAYEEDQLVEPLARLGFYPGQV